MDSLACQTAGSVASQEALYVAINGSSLTNFTAYTVEAAYTVESYS